MFEEQMQKVDEKADSFLLALIKSKWTWAAILGAVIVIAVVF